MVENKGSLEMYRDIFQRMIDAHDTSRIHNDSKDHACVLISTLLKATASEVWIYCTRLGYDVWGCPDVLEALRSVLLSWKTVHVLLRTQPSNPKSNEALKLFDSRGIPVRVTHNPAVKENFIVIDRIAYRFEEDPEKRSGFACANDKTNADVLVRAFDVLNEDAEPYKPAA